MDTGRVPPLVWHSNTWMVHWVHGVLDQQERLPHTTVTQPTLKQPWTVWSDSSTAYRTQTTTGPNSWGWTELGQTQPKTPHCGVHQLQAVLVAVLTDLLFMLLALILNICLYTAVLLTYCHCKNHDWKQLYKPEIKLHASHVISNEPGLGTRNEASSLVSAWECILQRVLLAAATLVIISDSVTNTIEVVHCDEWWTDYWWNITWHHYTVLGCVDIQPHPHRSWPTSRLLSLQGLVLHPMWYTSLQ